jgi:uncharacterized NAD(P)/FAD-binding protein YdhS
MRVAIIGGGLSGTAMALQLLRNGDASVHVTLIERSSRQFHRGVAYSALLSQQLLNVPAARMGLFPDAVEDFHLWSRSGPSPQALPGDFLPRRQFGDYVQERFNEAVDARPDRVTVLRADVVAVHGPPDGTVRLEHSNGATTMADRVVLAMGNAPPAHVPGLDAQALHDPHYVPWPWKPNSLNGIAPNAHVILVGSGLTMVDLVLSLTDQGHTGPVTVISRRGFLPRPHGSSPAWTFTRPLPDVAQCTALDLLRWVRSEVRTAAAAGLAWQSVVDAVRHHVQGWWQALPVRERQAFLRHVRPFWEIHRHRMPADVHQRLQGLRDAGRLVILAGRVIGSARTTAGLVLEVLPRNGGPVRTLGPGHVINCTGPQSDGRRIDQPVLLDLLEQGRVVLDDLNMGLRCTPDGALIDAQGRVSDRLFAIGPMCKATLWECTAVPEIRDQAQRLVPLLTRQPTSTRAFIPAAQG